MRKFYLLFIPLLILALTSCTKECDCTCCEDDPTPKTLTLQPGSDGEDAMIAMRTTDGGVHANGNHSGHAELNVSHWTYDANGWGVGPNRSFFKFTGLSEIPSNATVKSAKLSLFGVTSSPIITVGNSHYPGSPYTNQPNNKTWLKRVTGSWSEASITWNNKPSTTDANQVEVPGSNLRWAFNVVDLDVTNLVKDLVSSGQNHGFSLQLQVEEYYRSISFHSSEATDATKRPKLVVEYEEQ